MIIVISYKILKIKNFSLLSIIKFLGRGLHIKNFIDQVRFQLTKLKLNSKNSFHLPCSFVRKGYYVSFRNKSIQKVYQKVVHSKKDRKDALKTLKKTLCSMIFFLWKVIHFRYWNHLTALLTYLKGLVSSKSTWL